MVFAVSVTTKRTSTPSRLTLPFSTMPPMRKVLPSGASCAATCDGVKKNTRFSWNAISTSAVAALSTARPPTMATSRLCLGFTRPLPQQDNFEREAGEGHGVGPPDVKRVAAHGQKLAHGWNAAPCSRMMQRTRASETAIEYSQKAAAMRSIPVSMVAAMLGARVRLTDAPWCSVFHHCTE